MFFLQVGHICSSVSKDLSRWKLFCNKLDAGTESFQQSLKIILFLRRMRALPPNLPNRMYTKTLDKVWM